MGQGITSRFQPTQSRAAEAGRSHDLQITPIIAGGKTVANENRRQR